MREPLPPVRADITKIHGRVVNLFTNAWQALEGAPERVDIRVEAAMLGVAVRMPVAGLAEGKERIAVRDNGKGMSGAVRARIVEPFLATKSAGQERGLGLSAIHTIVNDHGGGVSVSSQPGAGGRCLRSISRVKGALPVTAAPTASPAASKPVRVCARKRNL